MLLVNLLLVIPILIIVLAFIRLSWAIPLYIFYLIIAPYYRAQLMGVTLGLNLINIFLLVAFFVDCNNKKQSIKVQEILPFIFFFIITLLIMPLQSKMPIDEQFMEWKSEALSTLVVPLIIFNLSKRDASLLREIKWSLWVSMLIAGLYAIYLMFLPNGLNPYVLMMTDAYGIDVDYIESYSDDSGRSVRRIFSTFSHPMAWSLCLSLFLFVFYEFKHNMKGFLYYGILGLSLFNLFTCGVRTGLAAFSSASAYILYKMHMAKYILYVIFFLGVLSVGISLNKDYQDYFISAIDDSKTANSGSNLDMRLYQWQGVVDVVRGNELFGNGYRYPSYYKRKYGRHPKAYSFESLLFVVYTSWGYIGFVIWGIMFYLIFRNNHRYVVKKTNRIGLNALLLLYIVFSLITGEYNFLSWFAIFYSIMYSHILMEEHNDSFNKLLIKLLIIKKK